MERRALIHLDAAALGASMLACFGRTGAAELPVRRAVESMIETSLRGVDSHGVNLFPHYLRAVRAGRINREPHVVVSRATSAAIVVDGDHSFGHHAGTVAMNAAREAAEETGVAVASVARSTHFGAAAYFALPAARDGFIGMAFTNADALVKAHGGLVPAYGTNPICFCAPMEGEDPFCLDMATSTTSWNRVRNHAKAGKSLPAGLAFDADGRATRDPRVARMLAPIGGYKGFGLGMMIEILCGVLADGPVGREILPMFSAPIEARRNISHFFLALRIDSFLDLARFRQRLKDLAVQTRALPTNGDPVQVPGDPEKAALETRTREGIPMEPAMFTDFMAIDERFASCRIG